MSETTHLKLPYLEAAQAQKHVTVNETFGALDTLVQLSVKGRTLAAPPATPAEGERYIVATGATAGWGAHDGEVAAYIDGAWRFFVPGAGWVAWVEDEAVVLLHTGALWDSLANAARLLARGELADGSVAELGVNGAADTMNRLTVKSDAVLISHDDVTPGSGDAQVKVNKSAAAKTGSLLFQTGFSGRAEMGLAGDDDFRLKVSPDGATWTDALSADRSTGVVTVGRGLAHGASGKPLSGLIFTPGGDGTISFYRNDTSRTQNPRTATIGGVASDVLTLTASVASPSSGRPWRTSPMLVSGIRARCRSNPPG